MVSRIISLVSSSLALFFFGCQEAPVVSLNQAKAALDSAAAVGALRYTEETYREAEQLIQDGWMEMARQNGRLAPFRNYYKADSLLQAARLLSEQAIRKTLDSITFLEQLTARERSALWRELTNWRDALNGSLVIYKAENHWATAELNLLMSDRLAKDGEYEEALAAIGESKKALKQLGNLLAEYVNDEKKQIAQWRRWVTETVSESRQNNSYAVIVVKNTHKTYLLKDGKITRTYNCELGWNSARQKLFAGDGATPEGKYHITAERSNGSKYYKALYLNYPNDQDIQRFRNNKARNIISKRAGIGRNIEIHGGGGENEDWTNGCVALTNQDMDHLMKYTTKDTPVTIVRRSDKWP
ncbi:MAG: L,D-transpeptidase [bacterium]